jgi:hypothetical protein
MHSRPALAHKDTARGNQLAAEPLHTQALRIAVTTVSGTSTAFFMCHTSFSNSLQSQYL